MAPVLLYVAFNQQAEIYMALLIFTLFTDVLDGFLARKLNMITDLGAHLDSWGDFIIYTTLAIAAWWLWPDIIKQEFIAVIAIIISFTVPVIIGLIKFHKITSYHTWSVKLAVLVTVISYVIVFTDLMRWPLYVAAAFSCFAAIEEIAITIILKHERADVRSIWHALKYKEN